MTLTDNGELQVLDEIFNAASGTFPAADPYISLHTANPGEGGGSETAGGSYVRQQAAFGAAAAGTLSNTANIVFSNMPSGDVVGWGVNDASTAGNFFMTGWFSTISFSSLCNDTTADTFQLATGHGLVVDDRVVLEVIEALSVPTGTTAGTIYYVGTSAAKTITLSTTAGNGAPVAITAEGYAIIRKVVVTTLTAGATFQINAGDLDIFAE